MKVKSDISELAETTLSSLRAIRDGTPSNLDDAVTDLEFFVAIALRVMAGANPSKVYDAARLVTIQIFTSKK
jgi:hypothetical protein